MKFDFEKLSPTTDEGKANISKIEKRAEAVEKLNIWAKEKGNPLVFVNTGLENFLEFSGDRKIKQEVLEGLSEENIEYIKNIIENFIEFVSAPIFMDAKENHVERRTWEEEFIENHSNINPEAKKIYKSNRLNANTGLGTTAYFFEEIAKEKKKEDEKEDMIVNPAIKKILYSFFDNIPPGVYEKHIDGDGEMIMDYYKFSNEQKVKLVEAFTEIIVKTLRLLLEEKK